MLALRYEQAKANPHTANETNRVGSSPLGILQIKKFIAISLALDGNGSS
jgi:hypothetical protein